MRGLIFGLLVTVTIMAVVQQEDETYIPEDIEQPETDLKLQIESQQPDKENQIYTPLPPLKSFKFDQETLFEYRYECGAIICILIYLSWYHRSKSINSRLIEQFYQNIKAYIQNNFAHIGFTKTSGEQPLFEQSAHEAILYASGRENVDYMEVHFNLLKRQDLIYYFIFQTVYPQKDLIVIDISVKTQIPLVFMIAQRKKLRTLVQSHIDIKEMAGSFDVKNLNSTLEVLGQTAETIDSLLGPSSLKKLNSFSSYIQCIHYSDQKLFSNGDGNLRAVIYAKPNADKTYVAILDWILGMVDKIVVMKLSSASKQKALKSRQQFNLTKEKKQLQEHKQKLQKEKEEKRKQQDAWIRSLPPEKQKRQEEKRQRKELNKMIKTKPMKVS